MFGLYLRVHGVYGLLAVPQLHRVHRPILYSVLVLLLYRMHAMHGRLYCVFSMYRVHEMFRVYVLEMFSAYVHVPYRLYRLQPSAIVWEHRRQAYVAVAGFGSAKIEGSTAARSEAG